MLLIKSKDNRISYWNYCEIQYKKKTRQAHNLMFSNPAVSLKYTARVAFGLFSFKTPPIIIITAHLLCHGSSVIGQTDQMRHC